MKLAINNICGGQKYFKNPSVHLTLLAENLEKQTNKVALIWNRFEYSFSLTCATSLKERDSAQARGSALVDRAMKREFNSNWIANFLKTHVHSHVLAEISSGLNLSSPELSSSWQRSHHLLLPHIPL